MSSSLAMRDEEEKKPPPESLDKKKEEPSPLTAEPSLPNGEADGSTAFEPRLCSQAVAFGSNYYYALGGATCLSLNDESPPKKGEQSSPPDSHSTNSSAANALDPDNNNAINNENENERMETKATTKNHTKTKSTATVRYEWEIPPWVKGREHSTTAATTNNNKSVASSSKTNKLIQLRSVRGSKSESETTTTTTDDLEGVLQAVATAQSTIFLTPKGKVYQTGTMHGQVLTHPTPIAIPLPIPCVELAAGRHFCLARMQGGIAVCSWGAGHFGQLGIGAGPGASEHQQPVTFTPRPILVERLLPRAIGSNVIQIAAGDWHGLALTESGMVWAWGSNRSQQCGRKHKSNQSSSDETPTLVVPTPIPLDVEMGQIAAGRSHSLALTKTSQQVYSWGSTIHGQCGHAVRRSPQPPRLVEGMRDLNISKIAAGGNHSLALTVGGRLFSWGQQTEGQLGLGTAYLAQPKPRLVSELDFVAIVAGQEWRAQKKQKSSSPVASNDSGDQKDQTVPLERFESPLKRIPRVVDIFAGPSYSIAVSSSGHAYCFGSNDAGQLGLPAPPQLPLRDNSNAAGVALSSSTGATSYSSSKGAQDVHVQTFDSRHNVLLPTRVNQLVGSLRIRTIACGPNHVWFIGDKIRESDAESEMIGKTLHEVQLEKDDSLGSYTKPAYFPKEPYELHSNTSSDSLSAPNTTRQAESEPSNDLSMPQSSLYKEVAAISTSLQPKRADPPADSQKEDPPAREAILSKPPSSPSGNVPKAATTASASPKTHPESSPRGPRAVISRLSLKLRKRLGASNHSSKATDSPAAAASSSDVLQPKDDSVTFSP